MDNITSPINPSIILKNLLQVSGMSQKELAIRTGVTEKHICNIIKGEKEISDAFARKLSYALPHSEDWAVLQAKYKAYQLKLEDENSISEEEINVLKQLKEIIGYCIEKKFMHNHCSDAEKVLQLRELLKISDLTSIPKITYNAAYRAQISSNAKVNAYVLFAWQMLCEKETESENVVTVLNKSLLKDKLNEIRSLMFDKISDSCNALQQILAECGIIFHIAHNFRGAPVQGFIKPTSDNKLLLCLTIRRNRADIFWFTLFHEIAHVLHGDFATRFVDFESVETDIEAKANKFARDILISPIVYRDFVQSTTNFNWSAVLELARRANVTPTIALGRLQKDELVEWNLYSDKVERYQWVQ
ncbi:MAG: hypothetical protein Q4D21_00235 [Phascolarctobacterium sp.]|nr:hypothetical protein [Phascolarctobacterium sp.]